jgi:predicted MFS family arabinose efflux permease
MAPYAAIAWTPTFFLRVHHMTTADVGFYVGIASGGGYAIGNFLGGAIADRAGRFHFGWYPAVSAIVILLAIPFLFLMIVPDGQTPALVGLFGLTTLIGAATPAGIATNQALAKPSMRATASAIHYTFASLIGLGGGPFFVGLLNDRLAPAFGSEAIRYSILGVVLISLIIACIAYAMQVRFVKEEVERARS